MKKTKVVFLFIVVIVIAIAIGFLVHQLFFSREKMEDTNDEGTIFLSCHLDVETEEGLQTQVIQSLQFEDGKLISMNYDETMMITEESVTLTEKLNEVHEECLENNDNRVPGMINNCRLEPLRHTWIQSFDMEMVRRFLDRNDQVQIDELLLSERTINQFKIALEDRGFVCTRSDDNARFNRDEFEERY